MQKVFTAGTSVLDALPYNPNRKYLLIVNMSTNNVFIRFGDEATTSIGIPLYGQGTWWESPPRFYDDLEVGDNLFGNVSVIASAASSTISVTEKTSMGV